MHPWTQIVFCFCLSFLALVIFGCVGWLLSSATGKQPIKNIFSFSFLWKGLLFCTSLYAIIITGFKTILLPVPLLLFLYQYFDTRQSRQANLTSARSSMYVLFGCVIIQFVYYLQGFLGFQSDVYTYPDGDHLFYSRLIQYINIQGLENPRIEYLFPERFGAEPYHWGDIWLGALVNGLSGVDQHYVFLLVAGPVLSAVFASGIYAYATKLFPAAAQKKYLLWLLAFAPLISGLAFFYPSFISKPFYFDKSSAYFPKVLWVGCLLIWLLSEVKERNWNKTLICTAVSVLTFVNILPAFAGGIGTLIVYLLITKKATFRGLLPGLVALTATALYYIIFYQRSRSGDVAVYTLEQTNFSVVELGKLLLKSVANGLLQMVRLIPYLALLTVAFWGTKGLLKREKLSQVPLELLMLAMILAAGLLCWGALATISRDAIQCFQNVYMPAQPIFIVILLLFIFSNSRLSRYRSAIMISIVILNVVAHFRFNYQIWSVPKQDFATAVNYIQGSSGIMVHHKSPQEMRSKYSANTILEEPLGYLDYVQNVYVNASLDAPFAQFDDVEPYQMADIQSVLDWAPISYHYRKAVNKDKDTVQLSFAQRVGASHLVVSPVGQVPVAFQPYVADSLHLKSAWKMYRLTPFKTKDASFKPK